MNTKIDIVEIGGASVEMLATDQVTTIKPFRPKLETAQHTPGPWAKEGDAIWGENRRVCIPCSIVSSGQDREYDANARLIAAAPALAEALRQAYVALEKSVHFEMGLPFWRKGGDGYSAMLEARAALALAEGEL